MDWTPLLVAVAGAAVTGIFALLIALLVWVLNRLWKVNDGIASLREGQVRLEERQAFLREGQARLEEGQAFLREGQARLEEGQTSLREGQAHLESGQQEIIRRLERLESPHPLAAD